MARRYFTDPKIEISTGRDPVYFIRPYVPMLTGAGVVQSIQQRITLGRVADLTKKAAKKKKSEVARAINQTPLLIQSQIQFSHVVEQYLEVELPTRKPGYRRTVRNNIEHHVMPTFGDRRLCDITRLEVQAWVNQLTPSRERKRIILSTLSSIMEMAAANDYTQSRNPCRGIKLGQVEPEANDRKQPLSAAQIRMLVYATEEPLRTMIEVAATTGVRIGEIRAIGPQALRPPYLYVFRQICGHTDEIIPPKNGKPRNVPCPEYLLERLANPTWEPHSDDLVFPRRTYGKWLELFKAAGKSLGIDFEWFGWHTLRRTHATLAKQLVGGVEDVPAGLQEAMGHSKASTTKGYIRPVKEQQVRLVEGIAAMLMDDGKGGVQ